MSTTSAFKASKAGPLKLRIRYQPGYYKEAVGAKGVRSMFAIVLSPPGEGCTAVFATTLANLEAKMQHDLEHYARRVNHLHPRAIAFIQGPLTWT